MKKIYTILFVFVFITHGFSQSKKVPVFNINGPPSAGLLLDEAWKFYPGDNIEFAKPGFDDSDWEDIDPTKELYYLPQIKKESVGWLRIHLHIDSSLMNKPLAFQVYQSLASEIYLDGKLIKRYGIVSPDSKKVIAFQPLNMPVGVQFDHTDQVLAVRFSVNRRLPYLHFVNPYSAFQIRVNDVERAAKFRQLGNNFLVLNSLYVGIFIVLTIIHFGLYIIFRQQKTNLYFSIATFSGAVANGLFIGIINSHDVAFRVYAVLVDWPCLFTFFNLFLFIAIHYLFSHGKSIYFRLIVAYSLMSPIFWVFIYERGELWAFYLPFWISMIESLRISTVSWRKGHRYASMIVAGIACYLIFMSVFALIYEGFISNMSIGFGSGFTLMDALYQMGVVSVPLALSLYLARDFAFTSNELSNKLHEVEQLSSEKQRILEQQNITLEKKVAERTSELNQSLENLQSTQSQLIQSEKMASLGELTAGIAHEIQNPLNFVNNFSEVNTELIDEMQQQIDKGNYFDAKATSNNIKENELKINHHGKRADAIVKGMLQHSRESRGQKEPTDINALADEYLRLSYYGFRDKDKSFNATIITDFDSTIGRITIIPQDIGRVLLNLYNNAFYAISEEAKRHIQDYEPKISLVTKRINDKVEIMVKDNGVGIAQKVMDKIFQPFFTTKPTGQGTGLGLSLSYDIIKAHGGELKVESKGGNGAEFVVLIPVI